MNEQQYAISEYLNVDEVYARLNALISQPIGRCDAKRCRRISITSRRNANGQKS